MAEIRQAVHRPGPLKQQNKVHKHGKHKSKGELASEAKGRGLVAIRCQIWCGLSLLIHTVPF